MDERPSLAPPDGYEYHGELFGSMRQQLKAMGPWRSLLAGNLLALVPLAAAIALLWLPYQFYRMRGAPLAIISFAGGVALLLLPPSLGELMLPALLLNAAAAVGDLLVAVRVWRAPLAALFASDQEILVFMPAQQREINGCPKKSSPP